MIYKHILQMTFQSKPELVFYAHFNGLFTFTKLKGFKYWYVTSVICLYTFKWL